MGEGVDWKDAPFRTLELGKAEVLAEGDEVALICTGPVTNRALEAASSYPGRVGVYNFRFVKPLDEEMLAEIAGKYRHIITVEDASLKGGLYGAVCEFLMSGGYGIRAEGIGVPDRFIAQDRQSSQLASCGLDREGIEKSLKKVFVD